MRLPALTAPDGTAVNRNAGKQGVAVVVFLSPECPVSNAFAGKSVPLARVVVDCSPSYKDVPAHARDFLLKFPVKATLGRRFGRCL